MQFLTLSDSRSRDDAFRTVFPGIAGNPTGETLSSHLAVMPGGMPSSSIAAFAVKAIETLRDVHRVGFVHGGIDASSFVLNPVRLVHFDHSNTFLNTATMTSEETGRLSRSEDMRSLGRLLMSMHGRRRPGLQPMLTEFQTDIPNGRPYYEEWIQEFAVAAGGVDANGLPIISSSLEGVSIRRAADFAHHLKPPTPRLSSWAVDNCPPSTIFLWGKAEPIMIDASRPSGRGSGADIYRSISHGGGYVVRVARRSKWAADETGRYRAFKSAFGSLHGATVASHRISSANMSPECESRTMVLDSGGQFSLLDLAESRITPERIVARIAVRAIRILRTVHSTGMVHGDVYLSNFVFSNWKDPAGGLRIIDFGRTSPFVDTVTGTHIAQSDNMEVDMQLNSAHLSPFEIEGSRLSRRDDMYRLSELLFMLRGSALEEVRDLRELARLKRQWKLPNAVNNSFNEFHGDMISLAFEDRPNYEKWIAIFSRVAGGKV